MTVPRARRDARAPSDEYRERIALRRGTVGRLDRLDLGLSYARFLVAVFAVVLGVLAWRAGFSFWWLLVPAAVFALIAQRHDRVLRARAAAERGITFYERGLGRIAGQWAGAGEAGDRFRDEGHPYANDLDLFGRGSLFELLSLARTRTGEAVLAAWLKTPADAPEIAARQEAIAELTSALDLREQMAMAGADVRAAVQTDRLLAWAESSVRYPDWIRVGTWVLSAAALAAMIASALGAPVWPLGAVVALEVLFASRVRRAEATAMVDAGASADALDRVGDRLTHRARDLDVVAGMLRHLEHETFRSGRLSTLHRSLMDGHVRASRVVGRLHRISEMRDWAGNFGTFALLLFLLGQAGLTLAVAAVWQLWNLHILLAVERWRVHHGAQVRTWLDTVAEVEALGSLAGYRYEHPDDPFPVIATPKRDGGGVFAGTGLGHPLLGAAAMVRNDVTLGGATRLLVVSGSNMSGKSTLLRTVGINAVLALAGAPVRACSLQVSPLVVGATLRIEDSLQAGRSRFYAEITRIRELVDLAGGPVPLLFLLDELFHGTNSDDRLVGASGVLRTLMDRGAVGLITTHDLALTAIADQLSPRARNVHFEDTFEGGEMRFDYQMKSGPVTRSNALALMRAVGIDLDG